MKKFLLFIIVITVFSSCSSDEDTAVNNIDVTGVWREVAYQATESGAWQEYSCDDNILYLLRYNFNSNGNVYKSPYCEGHEGEFLGTGTYAVQGDVLKVVSSGESFSYKVLRQGTTLYMQQFYLVNGENVYYSNTRLIKE